MADTERLNGLIVEGTIIPGDYDTGNPTHIANYGKGGYKIVSSLDELYNTSGVLTPARLIVGTKAYVVNEKAEYRWNGTGWDKCTIDVGSIPDSVPLVDSIREWYCIVDTPVTFTLPADADYVDANTGKPKYRIDTGSSWDYSPNGMFAGDYVWSDNAPMSWTKNQYLWVIKLITFKNGGFHWADPQCIFKVEPFEGTTWFAYKYQDEDPELPDEDDMNLPPEGWSSYLDNEETSTTVWMITAKGFIDPSTGLIDRFVQPWSGPLKLNGRDGKPGEDGNNVEYIYATSKLETDVPIKPTYAANGAYQVDDYPTNPGDPSTFTFPGSHLQGQWFDHPQGITADTKFEWISMREKGISEDSKWSEFTDPVLWSKYGTDGKDGDGIEYIYLLSDRQETKTTPSVTRNDVDESVNYINYSITHNWGSFRWTDDPTGVSSEHKFEYVSQRRRTNGVWGTFSTPALWAKYADDWSDEIDVNGTTYQFLAVKKEATVSVDDKLTVNIEAKCAKITDDRVSFVFVNADQVAVQCVLYNRKGEKIGNVQVTSSTLEPTVTVSYTQDAYSNQPKAEQVREVELRMFLGGHEGDETYFLCSMSVPVTMDAGAILQVTDQIRARVQDLSGNYNDLSISVGQLSGKIENLDLDALNEFSMSATGWSQTLHDISGNVYDVSLRAGRLESSFTDASGRINRLEASAGGWNTKLTDLEASVSSVVSQSADSIWAMVESSLGNSGILIDRNAVTITGTLQSSATDTYNNHIWSLWPDGRGWLADGAIQWNASGDITLGQKFTEAIEDKIRDAVNDINESSTGASVTTYTWIVYSSMNNPTSASSITTSPTSSTAYMAILPNRTSQSVDTTPSLYTNKWVKIKGEDGEDGQDGKDGKDGSNGQNGNDGDNGNDGRSITSIVEYYKISASQTGVTQQGANPAASTGWTTQLQIPTPTNKYLWNYEVINFNTGLPIVTNARVIGVYGDKGLDGSNGRDGQDGDDGKFIINVVNYYKATTSKTSAPSRSESGWTTTIPSTFNSTYKYLWNYEKDEWSDGSVTYVDPHLIGAYGDRGDDGDDGVDGSAGKDAEFDYLADGGSYCKVLANGNLSVCIDFYLYHVKGTSASLVNSYRTLKWTFDSESNWHSTSSSAGHFSATYSSYTYNGVGKPKGIKVEVQ